VIRLSRPRRLGSPVVLGALLVIAFVAAVFLVYQKSTIATALRSGDTVTAKFARDYRLTPNSSDVKMAGVVVGTVTDVDNEFGQPSVVAMKLDSGIADKLGNQPSAKIRPTTLLGGNYYVELVPGGDEGEFSAETIPLARTTIPVELDRVLAAIPGSARQGIQTATRQLDKTLADGGSEAVEGLLRHAPGTLKPEAEVLTALQGNRPTRDLAGLVTYTDAIADVMTRRDDQLSAIIDSAADTTTSLALARQPLGDTLYTLPATLTETREGMRSLQGSLKRIITTADRARPSVRELASLLDEADPVVADTRQLLDDLQPLVTDARPLIKELVPTAQQATETLGHIRGPMLDRVNGPIMDAVLSRWEGTGPYAGNGGTGHRFYEEVGYLAAHTAHLSLYGDKNGQMLGLGMGAGSKSVAGSLDPATWKLLQSLGALPAGAQLDRSGR